MKLELRAEIRGGAPRMLIWLPNPYFVWDRSRVPPTDSGHRLIYADPAAHTFSEAMFTRWTLREVLR